MNTPEEELKREAVLRAADMAIKDIFKRLEATRRTQPPTFRPNRAMRRGNTIHPKH